MCLFLINAHIFFSCVLCLRKCIRLRILLLKIRSLKNKVFTSSLWQISFIDFFYNVLTFWPRQMVALSISKNVGMRPADKIFGCGCSSTVLS